MTKSEFKERWESDASGGGITYNDIAECARLWGVSSNPFAEPIHTVRYKVLKAAETVDADAYTPINNSSVDNMEQVAILEIENIVSCEVNEGDY